MAAGQPEAFLQAKQGAFGANGNIGEKSRDFLQDWMNAYLAWAWKHAGSSAQGA